jgi:hypothetical protein
MFVPLTSRPIAPSAHRYPQFKAAKLAGPPGSVNSESASPGNTQSRTNFRKFQTTGGRRRRSRRHACGSLGFVDHLSLPAVPHTPRSPIVGSLGRSHFVTRPYWVHLRPWLTDSPTEASRAGSLHPPLGKLPGYEQFAGQAPFILLDHPAFSWRTNGLLRHLLRHCWQRACSPKITNDE